MKNAKKLLFLVLGVALVISLTACGGGSTSDSQSSAAADGSAAAEAVSQAVTQTLPAPDATLKDDSVLGNWTDASDSTRYAKVTKTDSGYQYQDPEGTYTATFADGVLKIKASDTDTADAYYDAASGNLLVVYQGQPTYFKKAQ